MASLIGQKPNQVSTNGDLGTLAFQDASNPKLGTVVADGLTVDTNTLVVDTVNDRVGIGNSSPASKLDVTGKLTVNTSFAGDVIANIVNSSTTGFGLRVVGGGSGAGYIASFNDFNNTNKFIIDGAGNVGVGTSTPSKTGHTALTINGTLPILEFAIAETLTGYILSNASQMTLDNNGAKPITFNTSNTERMRITSAGVVELAQGQLKFPATQVASADANTLDDYEEGTWTPTVASTVGTITTIGSNYGTYTKVGNTVNVRGYFNITTNGTGAGSISVTGLPFAISNVGGNLVAYAGCGNEILVTGNSLTVIGSASGNNLTLVTYAGLYPGLSGYGLYFSINYQV